ncbi:LysR family transcriptional regulator [Mycobacterium parmense]|uniref:Probable hydrogen peroxide-inducible genes activator n=1 Tax=Mycobacterium parmense TaxID=185642 RepID=A0A7I7YQT4_9MYCO|nr:LysR family transcriptional regulator [Mycobacterium parmense]MCV7348719.1 LysR family transcriptional regulator [Mycobacterium parmense]ORW49601.1 LysR family transcriptional regulator [Mycobacterium parmense]BBZ44228.1 LysR family transcriptional regulator [Mycobacterium parmense]
MEIWDLRVFVAVVEDGGLSAAARRLHISQPSLSQTIQALEKHLDVQLLTRSSTGVAPTAAGMTLLGEARAVIARYDQALAAMAKHSPRAGRSLRVGIPLELPPQPLSHGLASLAAAFPLTVVEVRHMSTARQIEALRAGELDLGLVRERPTGERLDVSTVIEEPLGVLLAVEQAEALEIVDGGVRLDRLSGLQWLGFPRDGSPAWYDEVTAVLRSHGVQPGPPASYTQDLLPELKLAAVSAGGKFALAPAGRFAPLPESVCWLALAGRPLVRRTWVVWPAESRRRDLAHLVAALEDMARNGTNQCGRGSPLEDSP